MEPNADPIAEPAKKPRGRPRKERVITRPEIRAEPRAEIRSASPQDAAKRAAEIMGHISNMVPGNDEFVAPPPPVGWSYEWKRFTTFNQEDPSYQTQLAQTGWEPVPLSRHPEMMPAGHKGNVILRKGNMLMQRPAVITQRFKDMELRAARQQVRAKEEQLGATPPGTLTRDHAKAQPKINKSYEPIEIPKD